MKGVQCYELFGGIALKNHTFSFFFTKKEISNCFIFLLAKNHKESISKFFLHRING